MKSEVFDNGHAAAAPKPAAHHDFRPDIIGLRALAVLSVLGYHAGFGWTSGGFAGVDIFFVISGFLISRIILSERAAGSFSLAGFYGKRVKRILPALLLVLFAGWIMGWFLLDPLQFRLYGGHMEASSYFSVNLWLFRQSGAPGAYFNPDARYVTLLHLWSLSIEEQFYLIWPALLLVLFRAKRFIAPAIGAIFLASLVFCIVLTHSAPTAAFYFLSTRAWELALGALLAWREVFARPKPASPLAAEARAGLGVLLMLTAICFFTGRTPWPGSMALVPTLGCALVISAPGARIGRILLGHRVAQFFGLISYPLYLWHWPLLSVSHAYYGDRLPVALTAALLGLAVLLAFLTWKFVERPVAAAYKRHPLRVVGPLLAGLALAGLLGAITRETHGFQQRFPANVAEVFGYRTEGNGNPQGKVRCGEGRITGIGTLAEERAIARSFWEGRGCLKIDNPDKPTILLVGDSHAMHFLAGLESVYADRANIVMLPVGGCAPLVAQTDWREGIAGTTRCQAFNEETIRDIVELKPAAVVVSSYFTQFYTSDIRPFPGFLKDFDANIEAIRKASVHTPIFIMGEVPTWTLGIPNLLGKELNSEKHLREFSSDHLNPESLQTDALFSAHRWGENVTYISQAKALCNDQGCRRIVGPRLPEDIIAMDYGHYTEAGSIWAVKNILAPTLDPILKDAARQSP